MDIRIRCPFCETKLVVGDELLGHSVRCEECGDSFTVENSTNPPSSAPSVEPPRPRRRRESELPRDVDDDDRTIDGYAFDDDRPIRHKVRVKPNAIAPIVFGAALMLTMLLVSVGLFFVFGFGWSAGSTPLPPGAKFRISNAGWIPNQGFTIDVETADGRPPTGGHRICWRTTDGRGSGHSTMRMLASQQTHIVAAPRARNQSYEIWIENEPSTGAKVSNVFLLP